MANEALIFELEELRFGIWAADIRQVIQAVAISKLPDSPPWLEGIINIHGRVVPVVDLRQLLRLPGEELRITNHLLVVALDGREIAIRVDRALDLIPLDVEALEEPQVTLEGVKFECRIGKTPLGLIHVLPLGDLLSPIDTSTLDESLVHQSGGVG